MGERPVVPAAGANAPGPAPPAGASSASASARIRTRRAPRSPRRRSTATRTRTGAKVSAVGKRTAAPRAPFARATRAAAARPNARYASFARCRGFGRPSIIAGSNSRGYAASIARAPPARPGPPPAAPHRASRARARPHPTPTPPSSTASSPPTSSTATWPRSPRRPLAPTAGTAPPVAVRAPPRRAPSGQRTKADRDRSATAAASRPSRVSAVRAAAPSPPIPRLARRGGARRTTRSCCATRASSSQSGGARPPPARAVATRGASSGYQWLEQAADFGRRRPGHEQTRTKRAGSNATSSSAGRARSGRKPPSHPGEVLTRSATGTARERRPQAEQSSWSPLARGGDEPARAAASGGASAGRPEDQRPWSGR